MDPRISATAHGHHGLVGRPSLMEFGMSDRQIQYMVRSGSLQPIFPPLVFRAPGAPSSREQTLLGACWAAGGLGVVSHRAAAWLWGLDGPFAQAVEVSVPRLLKHRPKGAVVTQPVLDRALDDALAKKLVSFDGLVVMLDQLARRGRPGVARLRASLAERTDVPSSYGLRDSSGRFVGRIDAVYEDVQIAIELNSAKTHPTPKALQHDLAGQNKIVACGFLPLRYTWADTVGSRAPDT